MPMMSCRSRPSAWDGCSFQTRTEGYDVSSCALTHAVVASFQPVRPLCNRLVSRGLLSARDIQPEWSRAMASSIHKAPLAHTVTNITHCRPTHRPELYR